MLTADVVAVGSELVAGEAVDTNSAWVSRRLADLGVPVLRHTSVADDVDAIVDALRDSVGRADVVIVTGGLGPTPDDLTRVALAQLAGVGLERSDRLAEFITGAFAAAGREMPASNLVQADVPVGARILPPEGTAAGLALDVALTQAGGELAATVYCLPGVPQEMQAMADRHVFGDVARRAGHGVTVSRLVRTAGMAESAVAEVVAGELAGDAQPSDVSVAYLASRGETRVRLTATADDRATAMARIDPVLRRITARLGAGVAGLDDEGPEYAVVRQLRTLGWTLGLAESMTAGGVAARIARVPGASAVLTGGLVTYAAEAKTTLAGVDPALLTSHGPVSSATAAAIAAGARSRLGCDVALGVVGVAGPATQGAPVGRVHLALVTPAGMHERRLDIPRRGRADVQDLAVSAAVDFLRRRIAAHAAPPRATGRAGSG